MSAVKGARPATSAGAGEVHPGAPPAAQGWGDTAQKAIRSVALFLVMQMALKYGMQYLGLGSLKPTPPSATPAADVASTPGATTPGAINPASGPAGPINAQPYWPLGTPLSMLLYTSTHPAGADLDIQNPLVAWDGLTYGNFNDVREVDLLIDIPTSVSQNNGSLYMDILLVKGGGTTPIGKMGGDVIAYRKQLTRFLPKKRVRKEKKLVGGDDTDISGEPPVEEGPRPIVAHWSNNLTISIVSTGGIINVAGLPPTARPHYQLTPGTSETPAAYYPPVFPNDFWLLRENIHPINSTDQKLPLHVNYAAVSNMKFNIFAAMTQSFEQAAAQPGAGGGGAEMDEIKRMLTETSPWLLITTAIVTLLHTVFEFLAFSSDVSHWRKKDKDLVGVSLNTILTNCFVQLVILLYLHDSSEETSFMILFGQGIGLAIEAWKITKVVNVRIRPNEGGIIPYKVTFEDKKVLSEDEKKTQEYDQLAFRLVSYAAIPTLMGYSVYSLLYETHRSWYSFIVTTLAQAIYMFGFVQLVPQLIINYKLKSVAHMPMKAMMYKTLSTVVDDFFAFCIRMPWLHRLACFRDDVVFLILLYQRWIYRVDYSRVNEYGQVNEGMVEPVGDEKTREKLESKKNK